MAKRRIQIVPMNRVEGDLKIRLDLEEGVVVDARSAGTMYRGFENILKGRGPLDGLVITPRVCGICSTSHLKAAAKALDGVYQARVPDNARRIRNAALMVEILQNDIRHSLMLFMADFTNPRFKGHSLFEEAVRRYTPLKGESVIAGIRETRRILEIVAILGGQWPHSSFMVPGGVVSIPSPNDVNQCRYLLNDFRKYFERRILGCRLERWAEVTGPSELDRWLGESEAHRESDLGFFIRYAREGGLHKIGRGTGCFLSFGAFELPSETAVAPLLQGDRRFLPAGFHDGTHRREFRQDRITEAVDHSWFTGYSGGVHPYEGMTKPYASGSEGKRYSWAKAPRYEGMAAETGPLAQMIVGDHPLITRLVAENRPNVFVRQLARLIRPAVLIPALRQWLEEIGGDRGKFFEEYGVTDFGNGHGLTEAPRGALGHWVRIDGGKIDNYQIITPTSWNASPRDETGAPGPMESALMGARVRDAGNPVEAGIILRSFDPCLVCTVHAVRLEEGE